MKIEAIRLAAYGPFSDVSIDLADGPTAFHLLYGPNEAGKSSTLRAIRHMLFGIPARTGDNFLHAYSNLRVGARLVRSDGRTIDFLRRKGHVKTLRGPDDGPLLDDDALAPFLGGVTLELFEQMFAIGHDDLIRGGEEIVSGKGRVGEALFAAGAGLIRLQQVQQELDQDSGALFKPSGSTPAINQTVAALKATRTLQKAAVLPAKTWQVHDRALHQARQAMGRVQRSLKDGKQQQTRLQRIRDALPLIARRKEILAELARFAGIPELAADFTDRRRRAEDQRRTAIGDLARLEENMARLDREMAALTVPDALLQRSAAIEALQHELGSFRKAQKDRPVLEGRMRTLKQQAAGMRAAMATHQPDGPDRLNHLPPAVIADIQRLGSIFERLTATREQADLRQRRLETRMARLRATRRAMPVPVDLSRLEAALQAARDAGPLETQLADLSSGLAALAEALQRRLARQSLWNGPLDDVDRLPLPSLETLDRFEKSLTAAARRIADAHAAMEKTTGEIASVQAALQAIDMAHIVPSEADLDAARATRDRGWKMIRQTLAGNPPAPDTRASLCREAGEVVDLTDAFETFLDRADHIADRLRREADQVSRKGLLEARRQQLATDQRTIMAEREAALAAEVEVTAAWRQLWVPMEVIPLSVPEMRAWLMEMTAIREKLSGYHADRCQQTAVQGILATHQAALRQALSAVGAAVTPGADLREVIRAAQALLTRQGEQLSRIRAMDAEIDAVEGELAEVASDAEGIAAAMAAWNSDWERQLCQIGLPADATSPTAALTVIDNLREASSKRQEADVLEKRIQGIDRDAAAFEARVVDLVAAIAPELAIDASDRAAEGLYGRLTAARNAASRHAGLAEQQDAVRNAQADARQRLADSQALLESLCREAACPEPSGLAEIEQRALRCGELRRTLAAVDDQLRHLGAGATVMDFVAQAECVAADSIDPELERLVEAIERLEQERSQLDQTIGTETAACQRMDGRAEAAEHAETAERLLARLESDVEQYACLKLAAVILARTVEQYREKHQGPLISRASELFARMTLGAFSHLRAEYDEKGNPILVGVRAATGVQVRVEGMSDGTADQLYLALRLASLEQYLEKNEALPFIVDDILLRFDDRRALATLEVLADLASRTQVLFFTHHHHLLDLAERSTALVGKFNTLRIGS